jgi:hypothetical protein
MPAIQEKMSTVRPTVVPGAPPPGLKKKTMIKDNIGS